MAKVRLGQTVKVCYCQIVTQIHETTPSQRTRVKEMTICDNVCDTLISKNIHKTIEIHSSVTDEGTLPTH